MIGNKYDFLRRIICWRALSIPNKQQRKQWRQEHLKSMLDKLVSNYKYGVSYSVFDGQELLEASIRSIREHVDYVNVVYQTKSWYGDPADDDLLPTLNHLVEIGLIDELIEYNANPKINAGTQERNKRNIGLRAAKRAGINYFMTMDTDEFYYGTEIDDMKYYIVQKGITHSFCNIIVYGKKPTDRILDSSSCYAAFFTKINNKSILKYNKHIPALIDPTRQIAHSMFSKYYVLPIINMHHMTFVRKNINKKFKSSSNSQLHDMQIKKLNTVKVKDVFNIKKWFNYDD